MSAWNDFVTAALLGAERGTPPPLPPELAPVVSATPALSPAERLLTEAGAYALWRRAGRNLPTAANTLGPAPEETLPPISAASASHLRTLMAEKQEVLLKEWLLTVSQLGRRLTPDVLPLLLKAAKTDHTIRQTFAAVAGERGRWLAAHHPQGKLIHWLNAEIWDTGTVEQRSSLLRHWRQTDLAYGRTQLKLSWDTEGPQEVLSFIPLLEIGLSTDDEPFLERVLDGKNVHVRAKAVDLLSRLPDAALTQRNIARADSVLTYKKGGLLSRASIEVQLPSEKDEGAVRDGVDPALLHNQHGWGKRALSLMLLLSTIPPGYWSEKFKATPAAILKALEKNDFEQAVLTGLAIATSRRGDADWARAILDGASAPSDDFTFTYPLLGALPAEAEDRYTRMVLEKKDTDKIMEWHALNNIQGRSLPRQLSEKNSRKILAHLRAQAAGGFKRDFLDVVRTLLTRMPPSLFDECTEGWPDGERVAEVTQFAVLRREVMQELLGPAPASRTS